METCACCVIIRGAKGIWSLWVYKLSWPTAPVNLNFHPFQILWQFQLKECVNSFSATYVEVKFIAEFLIWEKCILKYVFNILVCAIDVLGRSSPPPPAAQLVSFGFPLATYHLWNDISIPPQAWRSYFHSLSLQKDPKQGYHGAGMNLRHFVPRHPLPSSSVVIRLFQQSVCPSHSSPIVQHGRDVALLLSKVPLTWGRIRMAPQMCTLRELLLLTRVKTKWEANFLNIGYDCDSVCSMMVTPSSISMCLVS